MKNNYSLDLNIETEEQKIIDSLVDCINKNVSFVFNAGAGAGKTYALVQSLKYIVAQYSKKLKAMNQNIRVITFTNAAANEIKSRIGVSEIIEASTIHEFVWSIISNYPRELLICHLEEVRLEIIKKNTTIIPRFMEYLEEFGQEHVFQLAEKDEFYNLKKSSSIESFYNSKYKINNKKDFHSSAKAYISKVKLEQTRDNINNYLSSSTERIKKSFTIKYDRNSNIKNLNNMRIDHDLLLDYFEKIVLKYPQLKLIIMDKFPILFIDEFQDSNEKVIKIISEIIREKRNHYFIAGFFGDFFQNIYNTKNDLIEKLILEKQVCVIKKEINRRCSTKVIELANKFNYMFQQKTAYINHNDGVLQIIDVKENLDLILSNLYEQYGQLDCLVLKNKLICEKIQIDNVYTQFKKMNNYSGYNYDKINTELLSKEFDKLGIIQKIIYKFIEYYFLIKEKRIFLNEILGNNKKIKLKDILDFKSRINIELLNISNDSTLKDVLNIFLKCIENNSLSEVIKTHIFGTNEPLQTIFNNFLTCDIDEEPYDILTEIAFDEWIKWYNYVSNNDVDSKFIYHTYHGTKGLEYENVVIILDDSAGRSSNDLKDYLVNLIKCNGSLNIECLNSNVNLRNLLYVAITRSYKNLFILNNTSISIEKIETLFKIS